MEQGWSGCTLQGPKTNSWLEGEARCVLPNGIVYEGQFKGGDFHGKGVLIFPDGGRYTAEWECGRLQSGYYAFKDGLPYQMQNWSYLAPSDRRFVEEFRHGFDSREQCTSVKVPNGTYDTGSAFSTALRRCSHRHLSNSNVTRLHQS
ncbi:MORN repeat-containing protein 5-like [Cyclospora cayetanensis]|uniref:MORN repeat-containing protein 5 n=1 Tax=Cyclospora cayetanensis TaxID=88456 RepID=A0A6P6RRK5_9EIME|nr:MORN repeat-containing protein 5-like [Cyclospora cayetanensis]